MRSAPATAAELRAVFDGLINGPGENADVPDGSGLDDETAAAIERVWAAGPNPPHALVAAAREELQLQINGTHAREAAARERAAFDFESQPE
jgi:hypothetical protein